MSRSDEDLKARGRGWRDCRARWQWGPEPPGSAKPRSRTQPRWAGQGRAARHEGYVEMGRKGGSSTSEMSGAKPATSAGRDIDETKFSNM